MVHTDTARSAARLVPRPARDPGIPHPSWRQTITGSDQGAGQIVNAGDFWTRLGI